MEVERLLEHKLIHNKGDTMHSKPFDIIQLVWEGPLTAEQVAERTKEEDYGVYSIYGTHAIFGANSLLYIGQANSATFAGRISAHDEWLKHEATEVTFYLGRISNVHEKLSDQEWGVKIDNAEKIIIYECSPPYNSKGLKGYTITPGAPVQDNSKLINDIPTTAEMKEISSTLIVNLRRRNRLPLYCSSLSLSIDNAVAYKHSLY